METKSVHPRKVRVVDVFTDKALAGNQLAVVLDGRDMPEELMQRIAREMNFSETTFLLPPENPSHAARVRIFTPDKELPFAGHPTIGTAWVLVDEGVVDTLDFVLEEGSGLVPVRGARENGRVKFWMTHPKLKFGQVFPHARVASALGIDESEIVTDVPAQIAFTGLPFMFVALRSASAVDAAEGDRARLSKLLRGKVQGVYLFAVNGPGKLYGRMLAPDTHEDPATGSAAGPLGGFAVRYGLVARAPEVSIVSEQGTKMGRQSFLHVSLTYDDGADMPSRIEVGGSVMPVLSGTLADLGS
ncbi:MAG TPA: PhzF family phenazine biosynthesis protein [Candidatus Dormibacteraeota bacterium]|nr:PhzF family phenazine biosynthesis protein [Candidatus Dormibacteraeota bacterium]